MPEPRVVSTFSVRPSSQVLTSSDLKLDLTVYFHWGSSQPTKYMMCQPWVWLLSFFTRPVSPGWRAGSRHQSSKFWSQLSRLEMPVYRPPSAREPLSSVFWTARAAKPSSVPSSAFHWSRRAWASSSAAANSSSVGVVPEAAAPIRMWRTSAVGSSLRSRFSNWTT